MNRFAITISALFALSIGAHATGSAQQAFDSLKKLAGTWEGTANGEKVKVIYRLTGADSTLMETQFPGTGHEMITMYHMDGDKLMLTHYCAAMNQPTMRFIPGKDSKVIRFDFVSGSNMKPTDTHIHNVKHQLLGKDHLISEWGMRSKGKDTGCAKFDLHRAK